MPNSATLPTLLLVAALVGLTRNTPTQAATDAASGINAVTRPATPDCEGATAAPRNPNSRRRHDMNKKQLAALLAAIVRATQTAADTVMANTEDEARTLVGMQLRRSASKLVQDASGVDAETAATHLKTAQDTIAAEIAAKKAAKGGDADDSDD